MNKDNQLIFEAYLAPSKKKASALSFITKGNDTFVCSNKKPIEGKTTMDLTEYPTADKNAWDMEAKFNSTVSPQDRMMASRLLGKPVEQVRRIHGISIPDEFKNRGIGSALVLAHMQHFKDQALYNSQASPELTRTFQSLSKKGLIDFKAMYEHSASHRASYHALMLTDKGRETNPQSLIKSNEVQEQEEEMELEHTTGPDGTQYWQIGQDLHRDDGPAVIYPNGDQYWYKGGIMTHAKFADGFQVWYKNGNNKHREDGPAIIYKGGNGEGYYLDDKCYRDIDSWAKKVLEINNKPSDPESVQRYVQEVLRKQTKDLI